MEPSSGRFKVIEDRKIMATLIIWLDSREAKVFKREGGSETLTLVHSHGQKHHAQPHGKHTEMHHPEAVALFKELIPAFHDASEVLLMGPGEAKTQFQKYIKDHHQAIAKKVVGVETVDHPTDGQIREIAKKFFTRVERGL